MANLHSTWLPLVVIWEKCQMKNINPENNHGQPPLHSADISGHSKKLQTSKEKKNPEYPSDDQV